MIRQSVLLFCVTLVGVCSASGARVDVDPAASEFRVDVKATGHSFEVFLDTYEAEIVLDDAGSVEKAEFVFACSDLESDNEKRDRKMLKWLESETHGMIRFSLVEVKEEDGEQVAHGTLTMHGVSMPVSVPFTVASSGGKARLSGTATIDHRDFGLDIITMFFMKVNPELKLSFTLVGEVKES